MKRAKSWKKKVILVALIGLFAYLCFGGEYNFYNLLLLKHRAERLKSEIRGTERARIQLAEEVARLKSDETYIEKIAREQYKMGKAGEKIYIIKARDSE